MAIHIQVGKNNVQISKEAFRAHVQSIPCTIHCDASGKVKEYFDTYVKADNDNVLSASFRGYPLKGKCVELPDGYKGLFLHETLRPCTDKEERKFYASKSFDSITYWNWDKVPSKNDLIYQAMDWIDIAEVLHSPIMEE